MRDGREQAALRSDLSPGRSYGAVSNGAPACSEDTNVPKALGSGIIRQQHGTDVPSPVTPSPLDMGQILILALARVSEPVRRWLRSHLPFGCGSVSNVTMGAQVIAEAVAS